MQSVCVSVRPLHLIISLRLSPAPDDTGTAQAKPVLSAHTLNHSYSQMTWLVTVKQTCSHTFKTNQNCNYIIMLHVFSLCFFSTPNYLLFSNSAERMIQIVICIAVWFSSQVTRQQEWSLKWVDERGREKERWRKDVRKGKRIRVVCQKSNNYRDGDEGSANMSVKNREVCDEVCAITIISSFQVIKKLTLTFEKNGKSHG